MNTHSYKHSYALFPLLKNEWEENKLNQGSQGCSGWAAGEEVGSLRAGSFIFSHPRKELYGAPLVHLRCDLATTGPPKKTGRDLSPLVMGLWITPLF